jgi:outer membrane protein assembly factor BamA
MASDGGYQQFSYQVLKLDNKFKLDIQLKIKPVIREINIGFTDRNLDLDPYQLLSIKEGDFFETQKLNVDLSNLQARLETMGFPRNNHQINVKEKKDSVFISLIITLGNPRVFKRIKTNSTSAYVNEFLTKKFYNFYNKPFEFTRFKLYLDDAQKELFSNGYYLINMDFTPIFKKDRVILDIKVTNDKLFAFDFRNLQEEYRDVVHTLLKDLFRKYKRPLSESVIKLALEDHYKLKAMLNPKVRIETEKFRNRYMEAVTLYRIFLNENDKTRMTSLIFSGNNFLTKNELKELFYNEAFELAKLKYYDEEYLNYFVGLLKVKYIEKGFVQVKVIGPNRTFDNQKKTVLNKDELYRAFRDYVNDEMGNYPKSSSDYSQILDILDGKDEDEE